MKKRIAVIFLCLILLVCTTGCSELFWVSELLSAIQTDPFSDDQIYSVIADCLEKHEESFTVVIDEEYDPTNIYKIYIRVIDDHPEYFWVNIYGDLDGEYTQNFNETFEYTYFPVYSEDDLETIARKSEELEKVVRGIEYAVAGKATAYNRIEYLHDYLVLAADYDNATYDILYDKENHAIREDRNWYSSATAYGCLVEHSAICTGYTAAFQLLLNRFGYECRSIRGSSDDIGHIWNLVQIDNEYYYVDVTFDDPIYFEESDYNEFNLMHCNLCIDDEELSHDRVLDEGEEGDYNFGTKYNYYRWNGYYAETYDFAAVSQIFKMQADTSSRTLEVKFSNSGELENACHDLIDNERFFDIDFAFPYSGIHYIDSPEHSVLMIRFDL